MVYFLYSIPVSSKLLAALKLREILCLTLWLIRMTTGWDLCVYSRGNDDLMNKMVPPLPHTHTLT